MIALKYQQAVIMVDVSPASTFILFFEYFVYSFRRRKLVIVSFFWGQFYDEQVLRRDDVSFKSR